MNYWGVFVIVLLTLQCATALTLDTSPTSPTIIGEAAGFNLSVEIEPGELVPITDLTIIVQGATQQAMCRFMLDGSHACDGFTITPLTTSLSTVSLTGWTEGYNGTASANVTFLSNWYGDAGSPEFKYRIMWDTQAFIEGNYTIQVILTAVAQGQAFQFHDATPTTLTLTGEDIVNCFLNVQHIPVSCDEGEITSDVWNGCRFVTCTSSTGSFSVKACDKPGSYNAEFLELYHNGHTGQDLQVCFDSICINNNEYYKRTSPYPLCLLETPFTSITIADGYPLEHNVILECNADATSYDWDFGDGTSTSTTDSRTFHTFPESTTYRVQCTAQNSHTSSAIRDIPISTFVEPETAFPYEVLLTAGQLTETAYRFTCEPAGWRPDTYEWRIDGTPIAPTTQTIIQAFGNGTFNVTCTGILHETNAFRMNETHYDNDFAFNGCGTNCFTATDSRLVSLPSGVDGMDESLLTSIVAYYPEDGDHRDVVSGYDGVEFGTITETVGKLGGAYAFPGGDTAADPRVKSTIFALRGKGSVATSAWVKFDEGSGTIWQRSPWFDLYRLPNGHVAARVNGLWAGDVSMAVSKHPIPDDEWHHYVVNAFYPVTLYIDGDEQATVARSINRDPAEFWWGASEEGHGVAATIDEIGVWTRRLSDTEIDELYNHHAGRTYPFGTNTTIPAICYDTLLDLRVTCNGDITSNTVGGDGCRYVTCTHEGDSLSIKACNKKDYQPMHFELYRAGGTGDSTIICVHETCMRNEGYVRGQDYPICD